MLARRRVGARRVRPWEEGAGSIGALAVAAATLGLAALLAPVAGISAARHRAAAAADAAALAAAATISGAASSWAAPGGLDPASADQALSGRAFGSLGDDPCAAAEQLAQAHDAQIVACELDGLVVTVVVSAGTAFGPVRAAATAGPRGS